MATDSAPDVPRHGAYERQVHRLRNQISWISQITTALIATDNASDVYSIVLSGLVAPTGLGYSNVLLFDYDRSTQILRGRQAIFHETLEDYHQLEAEIADEAKFLEDKRTRLDLAATLEERLAAEAEYHALSSGSQWVTLFQRLNPDNDITTRLERLTFTTQPSGLHVGSGPIFEEVPYWRQPRLLSKRALGMRLPAAVASLLPENFAAAPIFTKKGLAALLLCDKRLEGDQPLSKDDLVELEWFARQSALAMENIELISDLGQTNSDLKQLDQLKTNFLSIISHELRTPLTSITGFVDLILEGRVGEVNENQRTLLGRVAKNSAHLVHLVNDLLEIAEIEAEGTIDVRILPVDPLGVLLDTLPKLEQRRRDANVKVVPVLLGEAPHIMTDERALGRILFHVIDNAMKFSPKNGSVEVKFHAENGLFFIDVCDRGPGIPREYLPHIFKSFYQGDGSLTRGHEGLGLGLAITKMLVQATKGQLRVESEPGQGSTFTVVFPVATT